MNVRRVVSMSGGKDSTAVALLAEDLGAGDVEHVFVDTGNEHEITLQYVHEYLPTVLKAPIATVRASFDREIAGKRKYIEEKWLEKGVPVAHVEAALSILVPTGNPFLDLCLWKGRFPSRKAQFCTQFLKRRVLEDFMLARLEAGLEVESWRGIRRDESEARKNAVERAQAAEGWAIVHPIVDWSAQKTVDFVRSRGVELNPLYSQGMGRVGCMPCINCSKDELLEISRRFPEHVARIREWERIVGMAAKGGRSSFFTERCKVSKVPLPDWTHVEATDDEPEHWLEPQMEALERCSIDQRIEWAKTSRGGRQFDLVRSDMPAPACSSLYGLCE